MSADRYGNTKIAKITEAAIDRCMEEIEDIICEADVSYPAGRDAGASIDFDRDAVLATLRALIAGGRDGQHILNERAKGPFIKVNLEDL